MFELFEKQIGYSFIDASLLQKALTHKSVSVEFNNERLEFFGDSLIGFLTSKYIFIQEQDMAEGDMTMQRACLISGKNLAHIATELKIQDYLIYCKSIKRVSKAMLEDAFEALMAAIYIDTSYDMNVVQNIFFSILETYRLPLKDEFLKLYNHPKNVLQETMHKNHLSLPTYRTTKESKDGFLVSLDLKHFNKKWEVTSKSVKEAEKELALKALQFLQDQGLQNLKDKDESK